MFTRIILWLLHLTPNRFHPLVWMQGDVTVGKGTYIGGFSEVFGKGASISIGDNCDIASWVVINVADSHLKTIGLSRNVELRPIVIGNNVFIGTLSAILGGVTIGHHSVIGAGVILRGPREILPYSLVYRDDDSGKLVVKSNYYQKRKS